MLLIAVEKGLTLDCSFKETDCCCILWIAADKVLAFWCCIITIRTFSAKAKLNILSAPVAT
jgi:hypothetical protein